MNLAAPRVRSVRAGLAALAVTLPLLFPCAAGWAQGGSLEYAVKATYLYKLAPFVEWPDKAFREPFREFNLCVVGDDPFGTLLDEAVKGQRVGEGPIVVRHLRSAARDSPCHIMYVAGSETQPVANVLELMRGTPVLTVTDSTRGGGPSGIINFIIEDGRVRFEIDDHAASENGLTISSKLLSLAVHVRPRV